MTDTTAADIFDTVSRPVTYGGRRVRALRIGDANDLALLKAISRGEFAVAGMRNRDLRTVLYPTMALTAENSRRLSGHISRLLRILRAHGVVPKIPNTHRYRLTDRGRALTAATFAARSASVNTLLAGAA